jgi:DNA-binding cell septation regulator SpoVG
MKQEDIGVDVRVANREGKVKAFADVTFALGEAGVLKLSGFSVIDTGAELRAVPPARKGQTKYFEVVALIGKIRRMVDEAILAEYRRVTSSGATA